MPHPRLPHDAQPPNPQPPHPHELRPQRQRLRNVAGPADPAIVHDIRPIPHGRHNILQRVQTRHRAVNLPARMVRNHNPIAPNLHRPPGIIHALDPLEAKRLAPRNRLPRCNQPRHLLPTVRAPVPDIVNPQGAGLLRLCHGIDPRRPQPLLEHRVAQAQIGADAPVESVVARGDVVVPPAQLPGIGREDAGREAAVVGAREEGDG